MKPDSTNRMRQKMNVVLWILVLLGFGVLLGRLYQLQIVDGEFYRGKALRQQLRPVHIPAKRGTIYDANMKKLAASTTVYTVTLSPAELSSPEELEMVADFLSETLGADREKIIEQGKRTQSYYEIVAKKVEQAEADRITQFTLEHKLRSVNLAEDSQRYYPYGNLASTVIGFTTNDNRGAYGLESFYEKVLGGTPGMIISEKNAKSGDMPYAYEREFAPIDGQSIVLTIDEVVQHSLERNLEMAVAEHEIGNRAAAIVMDVNTGAILGMATKPDFDPNEPLLLADPKAVARVEGIADDPVVQEKLSAIPDPAEREKTLAALKQEALGKEQFLQWRNKAISDPYEPGSVFKVITAAIALETQKVTPTGQHFYCPGYHIVAGRRKSCWKPQGHGDVNFMQALKFSCNPAFMMIGALIGPEDFYDFYDRFGLLEATRIDLPGEADGIFYDYDTLAKETGEELASSAFGQTFKVTPIQLATALSAAVNGGRLMQPYVVSQILDAQGNLIRSTAPSVKRQVISEEQSKILAEMMEHVVADPDASGRFAYVPGYRLGGKTGTSEKIDAKENGDVTRHILSFCGVSPADHPQYLCLMLFDEPAKTAFGSVIAAPVVGAVMNEILPYLGVEPQYNEAEKAKLEISVPHVTGQITHDAMYQLTTIGLQYKLVGNGTHVVRQLPASGQKMPRGGNVLLYTEEDTEIVTTAIVPDLVGMSPLQANQVLLNAGFNIRLVGETLENKTAVAAAQEPVGGTEAAVGSVVEVRFLTGKPTE